MSGEQQGGSPAGPASSGTPARAPGSPSGQGPAEAPPEGSLPGRIDSHAFARGRRALEGAVDGERLPRLLEAGAATEGPVRWWATGSTGRDALDRLRDYLTLRLEFTPVLPCARCLEPVRLAPVVAESRFRFAASEDQAALEDRTEVAVDVISHDTALDLGALIEDELLLSLPMFAAHDRCPDPL